MLGVTVIAVGKLREACWSGAVEEYRKRLSAYCNFDIVEISEHRLPANPSPAQIVQGLEAEADEILARIPARSYVAALCVEGAALTSEQLAKTIGDAAGQTSKLVWIIGSSYGLADRVKQAAQLRLSLSAMTLPHQLARVVLCEQLYRAMTILRGGKYHK